MFFFFFFFVIHHQVVMYHMMEVYNHIGINEIIPEDLVNGVGSFFVVAIGGTVIGKFVCPLTLYLTSSHLSVCLSVALLIKHISTHRKSHNLCNKIIYHSPFTFVSLDLIFFFCYFFLNLFLFVFRLQVLFGASWLVW